MVQLENISYIVAGRKIINDLSYKFNTGIYILQGESGIGKTTILNIIAGYIKATAGFIKIPENYGVSYMFQEDMLFHNITVAENFYIKLNAKNDNGNYQDNIEVYCRMFGIEDKLNSLVSCLSGGEKKRVQLAMLAMDNNDIILLDEPLANLDSENSRVIMDYLRMLTDKLIIIVSHQFVNNVDENCKLLELRNGKIYEK